MIWENLIWWLHENDLAVVIMGSLAVGAFCFGWWLVETYGGG